MYKKTYFFLAIIVTLALGASLNASAQVCGNPVTLNCTVEFLTINADGNMQTRQCAAITGNMIGTYTIDKGDGLSQVNFAEGFIDMPAQIAVSDNPGILNFSVSFTPNGDVGSFSGTHSVTYVKTCTEGGTQAVVVNLDYKGNTVAP